MGREGRALIRVFIACTWGQGRVNKEAMNTADRGQVLREEDLPGASLGGRYANMLTIPAVVAK